MCDPSSSDGLSDIKLKSNELVPGCSSQTASGSDDNKTKHKLPDVALIQHQIDTYEKPIVGANHVVEYHWGSSDEPKYVCELCNSFYKKIEDILGHMASSDHRHKFLRQFTNHEYHENMVMKKRVVKLEMREKYAQEFFEKQGAGKVRVVQGEPLLTRKSLAGSNMKESTLKCGTVLKLADLDFPDFSEAFIQKDVENYHMTIIGAKFLAEYHIDALHEPSYVCELCQTPGDKIVMLMHMSGNQHRHKFLCQFPRHPYHTSGPKQEKNELREEYAKYFHEKEGCGKVMVKFGDPVCMKKKDKRKLDKKQQPYPSSSPATSNERGGRIGKEVKRAFSGEQTTNGKSNTEPDNKYQRGNTNNLRGKRGAFHASRGGGHSASYASSGANSIPIGAGTTRAKFPTPRSIQGTLGQGMARPAPVGPGIVRMPTGSPYTSARFPLPVPQGPGFVGRGHRPTLYNQRPQ